MSPIADFLLGPRGIRDARRSLPSRFQRSRAGDARQKPSPARIPLFVWKRLSTSIHSPKRARDRSRDVCRKMGGFPQKPGVCPPNGGPVPQSARWRGRGWGARPPKRWRRAGGVGLSSLSAASIDARDGNLPPEPSPGSYSRRSRCFDFTSLRTPRSTSQPRHNRRGCA